MIRLFFDAILFSITKNPILAYGPCCHAAPFGENASFPEDRGSRHREFMFPFWEKFDVVLDRLHDIQPSFAKQ